MNGNKGQKQRAETKGKMKGQKGMASKERQGAFHEMRITLCSLSLMPSSDTRDTLGKSFHCGDFCRLI